MAAQRLVQREKILHGEKAFPIFMEYTCWRGKGGLGIKAELGVPASVVESEHQFVMSYKAMWEKSDVDVGAELFVDTQADCPNLEKCGFDKGYHSRVASQALDMLLALVATNVQWIGLLL